MTQRLAIRGNCYNGDKVIALLLLLGGSNAKGYDGSKKDYCYYINSKGIIDCILLDDMLITQWETHTIDSYNMKYSKPNPRFIYKKKDIDKELNEEFNEVYNAISDAYDKINEFYMKHCALGQNDIDSGFVMCDLCELWDSLGKCKEIGHEVAEHFTWDN